MISTWSGAAQESYLQCKKQWDDAAVALSQVLNSVGQAVGQAHQNYTAAESAARQQLGLTARHRAPRPSAPACGRGAELTAARLAPHRLPESR